MSNLLSKDYREFINQDYAVKKAKNMGYSYRAYARDLGLSSGYLSQVLKGQKKLSYEKAIEVSSGLNIKKNEVKEFLNRVRLAQAKSTEARDIIVKELTPKEKVKILISKILKLKL